MNMNHDDNNTVNSEATEGNKEEEHIEWEVSEPVWNNPFDNLKHVLRGLCLPDYDGIDQQGQQQQPQQEQGQEQPPPQQQQQQQQQQKPKETQQDEDKLRSRTFSTCSTTQVLYNNNINSTLTDDDDDDDDESIQLNQSTNLLAKKLAAGTTADATTPLISYSTNDFLEPFHNLKQMLFAGIGFCDPFEQQQQQKLKISIDDDSKRTNINECRKPLNTIIDSVHHHHHHDVDDCNDDNNNNNNSAIDYESKYNNEDDESDESDNDDDDYDEIIVETQPGTSRSYRAYQAIEMFCSAILILYITFQLLHRIGNDNDDNDNNDNTVTIKPVIRFLMTNNINMHDSTKWPLQLT